MTGALRLDALFVPDGASGRVSRVYVIEMRARTIS